MNDNCANNISIGNYEKYITKDIKITLLNEIEMDAVDIFIKSIREKYKENITKYNLINHPIYRTSNIHNKYNLKEQCVYMSCNDEKCCLSVKSKELDDLINYHYEYYIEYYPKCDFLRIKRIDINSKKYTKEIHEDFLKLYTK